MHMEAFTVQRIPLIREGDDVGTIISNSAQLEDRDIIVIASSIVAKSEGRVLRLEDVTPGAEAKRIARVNDEDARFVQVVLNESEEVLIESPFMLTQTHTGHICVNAGADRSNVEGGFVLLLPKDPDGSAKRIRDAIKRETNKHVCVIIADTCGRPFRIGQTGIAIGCAGISPTKDWRGEKDLFGRTLEATNEVVIDELAGFANLMMGEGKDATPVVIIRGAKWQESEEGGREIHRPDTEDLIKMALRASKDRR
ncbi:MAG: coenzyme F420-0:L-glutamate ligase [Methanosarcinales archaeon]|nr:MAG: coenzyme F420-0:L-glutamate ligase [Methanosarcinales archaeon]